MKKKISSYSENLSFGASQKIFENASSLRKDATEAELILWSELRNRKINNFKFRRQHPINNFIADFYCHEAKLIIEVDGAVHTCESVLERDIERENILKEQGIRIIRFTNDEIYVDLNLVLDYIKKHLEIQPHPCPSPETEG